MKHPRRSAWSLAIAACAGCLEVPGHSDPAPMTEQARLPETNPSLVSTVVAADRVTLTYAGPPDDVHLEPGNVIVGRQGGGYLRTVNRVEVAGTSLVVLTRAAVATDAIANADLTMPIEPAAARPGCDGCLKLPLLDVSGRVLVDTSIQGVPVKVTVVHGVADLEPSIDVDLHIARQHLDRLAVTAKGKLSLNVDVKLEVGGTATFQQEVDLSGPTATLYTYPFVFAIPTPIGPLPVAGTLELDAFAGFGATVTAGGSVTTGLEGSSSFQLDAVWDGGQWSVTNEPGLDGMIHRPQLQTLVATSLRAYVRPEVRVRFYGVAGPRASVTPSLKAAIAVAPPAPPTVTVDGCVTGQVGFDVTLFGIELSELSHDFPEKCRALPLQ